LTLLPHLLLLLLVLLQVAAHYDLLEEFGIAAPEEEVAAARCMDGDYSALSDAAWAAEAAKDRQAQVRGSHAAHVATQHC
jgi:hypothetical protein